MDRLVSKWISDSAFRSEFSTNPQAAAAAYGISLEDHEWAAISATGLGSGATEDRLSLIGNPSC
jgi:hypothetical protein